MLRDALSEKVNLYLGCVKYISAFIVLFMSAVLKAPILKIPYIPFFISLCQHNAWWIIILFTFVGGMAQYFSNRIGSPGNWQIVQYLLDLYREEIFNKDENTKEDAEHFHRVTLFKHFSWRWALVRWPWSGWVVPVARSGSTTRTKIQCFHASKERPDDAEGVAGQTWVRNRPVLVSALPDLSIENPQNTDIQEYAKRAYVTEEWIRNRMRTNRRGLQCRSLFGVCIEAKGVPWGVLVIDSRNPEPSRLKTASRNSKLEICKNVLNRLLEKV